MAAGGRDLERALGALWPLMSASIGQGDATRRDARLGRART